MLPVGEAALLTTGLESCRAFAVGGFRKFSVGQEGDVSFNELEEFVPLS